MPWKVGGSFETAAVTCERDWKECAIAVVNYLWCEVVSDVVDYLTKEGMIWVLVIVITSTILIRIKYRKKIRTEHIVLNRQVLGKVGHKIHDLELKVNVLTYKMQYGTWPLPHQIYNLNPKKLRKIRMTLSNPDDWKKIRSRRLCVENVSEKGSDLSLKSEDSTLQWQFLPLNSNEINNRQSSRKLLTQNGKYPTYLTNNTYNFCEKFTNTVYKCKSFLKELEFNNKCLHSLSNSDISSETSKASSLKTEIHSKQVALLMTEKKKTHSRDAYATEKEEKMNEIKCVKKEDEIMQNANKKHDAPSKELIPIFPISKKATHNTQSSRKTLFEVKKRLRSLHNMLRTYRNKSLRSSERQKSIDKINGIDEESLSSSVEYSLNTSKVYQCSNNDIKKYFNHFLSSESSFEDPNIQIQNKSLIQNMSSMKPPIQNISSVKSSIQNIPLIRSSSQNISSKLSVQNISSIKSSIQNTSSVKPSSQNISSPKSIQNISSKLSVQNISSIKSSIQNTSSVKPSSQNISSSKSIQNISSIKNFTINEEQGNVITSQNGSQSKMSNNSDGEEKSTALLLREALHFKKVLLTRVRKKCPIDDELLSELNDPNFPSIIVDVEVEEPPTGDFHDKINQCCIYLDMKQRRDMFPELLQQKIRENQNCISETPSQYFSITNLMHSDNVALKPPPVYEKVISIAIPVSVDHQGEIDKSMRAKTILRHIQFEDVILEHIQSIRDYIDTFLQSQNRAISKGKRDILRCLNETSHAILRSRSADQEVHNSSDPSINTGPNYKHKISIKDNTLKCYSDMCLRRNPGIFTIENKFLDKNNAINLKKQEIALSLPITLYQGYKNSSKSAHNFDNCQKHVVTDIKNDKIREKKK